MAVLAAQDLSVRVPGRTLVSGVSFSVEAGRTLAIVGESGSGKSVSLLAATGLMPAGTAVSGRVLHKGQDIIGLGPRRLRALRGREIGFVFQDPQSNLHPLKPVGYQIGEAITAHERTGRRALRERVLALLADVGIHNPAARMDDFPHQFSGGMRQRVMIAMAIALNPGLIIADEPTTALDVTVQAAILALLKRLQEAHGTALIFVSHDLSVVSDIADEVLVMRHGRAVEQGPLEAIWTRPREAYTRALIAAARHQRPAETPAPRAPGAVLLAAEGVCRSFAGRGGNRQVLNGISLHIAPGEILGLVGESGSGKSTFGRVVAGLDRPDGGSVALAGQIYNQPGRGAPTLDRQTRAAVQLVFQDPYASLNPHRRIGDILAEPFRIAGERDRRRLDVQAHRLLQAVELPEELATRFPAQLSGGQRQRVAIARALALQPWLVVADEPVSALDITTQHHIVRLIRTLRERFGTAFLFISHDLGLVGDLCDRVVVLNEGSIVEEGSAEAVFRDPQHPYTRRLLAAVPGRRLAAHAALSRPAGVEEHV